ncbi:hypothetical protein N7466_001503 [Penicillium verhagenii]|uniref:uncharacterized protein n=1 Tax=Penicillium verhagenii TaxID=1562060 RepID=UPI002544E27D|nr:uncharacterized protein N7466_001503 [Penicillium verhagenii]KAJ5938369.1 hypothetical protein N7466_001503 [Penicillium verhagenii]
MKLPGASRLDQIISAIALSLSVAVLVCLSIVFVGCTSPSAPNGLYFMKIDLTDFPQFDHLVIRDSPAIPNFHPPDISEGAGNSFTDTASGVYAGAIDASAAATSAAQGAIHAQLTELKSHLFQYYYVGLWGYCKSRDGSKAVCSEPRTSFSFDLSAVLDSTPVEIDKVLPKVDEKAISGYQKLSHWIISLYISGFVTTVLVVILGARRTFWARGNRLLALSCIVSALLLAVATVGVTVMYGLFTAGIKTSLHPFGVQAGLGGLMLTLIWLAASCSVAAFFIWLIQPFCCCI